MTPPKPVPKPVHGKPTEEWVNDLTKCPTAINVQQPGETCTVGDLHGNTMKLLWILIREGAIKMSEGDFTTMWKIYLSANNLSGTNLKRFYEVLGRITVQNSKFNLRLIGDVFADRGKNDYLTLKVLEKLHKGGIKPEILYSNHDDSLIDNYEKPIDKWEFTFGTEQRPGRLSGQQYSMDGLSKLIESSLIKHTEVVRLVHQYVIPNMRLLSYSLSKDGKKIIIFMHAPNDFDVIKNLFNALCKLSATYQEKPSVPYKPHKPPKSALELAAIIDKINEKWALLKNEKSHAFVIDTSRIEFIEWTKIHSVIHNFIWNRPGKKVGTPINTASYPQDYVEFVVHGHSGPMTIPVDLNKEGPKQVSVDTYLGFIDNTGEDIVEETYSSFITHQSPEYIETLRWIASIEALRDEVLSPETERYQKLADVVSSAHSLLLKSIKANEDEIKKSFASFKKAVDEVQKLNLGKILTWENVISGFLIFIPNFVHYFMTQNRSFWFRTDPINAQKFEQACENLATTTTHLQKNQLTPTKQA